MHNNTHNRLLLLIISFILILGMSACSAKKDDQDSTKLISLGDINVIAGSSYQTFGGYVCDATITTSGSASGPLTSYVLLSIIRNPEDVEFITDKQGNKWTSGNGSQMSVSIAWSGPLMTRLASDPESVNWAASYSMTFNKEQQFMIIATLHGGNTGSDWYAQETKTITPCK